jgi:hypothetical protein
MSNRTSRGAALIARYADRLGELLDAPAAGPAEPAPAAETTR